MRHSARVVVGAALVLGLAGAFVFAAAGLGERERAARFDQEAWLQPVESCSKSARGRMVDDLVAEHLNVGMPMSSVRALLGDPDQVTEDGVWFYSVSSEYGGFLPTCTGLELDVTRGHLVSAAVTRDD
jgi:hypothetical protein